MSLREAIREHIAKSADPVQAVEEIRDWVSENSPLSEQPIDRVHWVSIDQVKANDYNPNSVAKKEMQLLYTSVKNDGYTQPVVTIYNEATDKFEIVDGFHRYFTCKSNEDIRERNQGRLPIVVIKKDINERMAATVRHNRARGKHSVQGMSNMVYEMLKNGWSEKDICNELGMEADEVIRLKHITGFAKLFEGHKYYKSWRTPKQIKLEHEYREEQEQTNKSDTGKKG